MVTGAYNYAIDVVGSDAWVVDVALANAYNGVRVGTTAASVSGVVIDSLFFTSLPGVAINMEAASGSWIQSTQGSAVDDCAQLWRCGLR